MKCPGARKVVVERSGLNPSEAKRNNDCGKEGCDLTIFVVLGALGVAGVCAHSLGLSRA